MDSQTYFLSALGLVIISLVILGMVISQKRKQSKFEDAVREDELASPFTDVYEEIGSIRKVAPRVTAPTASTTTISIKLKSREHQFLGYDLLQALLSAGLRFGYDQQFHRHESADGQGAVLFSLRSYELQGGFDIHNMGAFQTDALVLFMRLHAERDNRAIFKTLLATASQLAEDLNATLYDHEEEQKLSQSQLYAWDQQIQRFETSLTEPAV